MREQTRGCIDPASKTDGILIMPILSDAILYTGEKPVRLKGGTPSIQSRGHVVAEFEQFRLDQLSIIFHAHPDCLVVRAGLEFDMVVLLQCLVHDDRQII